MLTPMPLTPVQAIRAAAPYPRLFAAELAARVAAAADFAWSRQQEEEEQRRQEEQRQDELMQVAQAAAAAAVADQRRIQQTVRMQLQQEADERAQYAEAIAAQSFAPIVARPTDAQLRAMVSSPILASPRLSADSPRVPPRVANRQQPRGSPVASSVPQLQSPRDSSPPPPPAPAQVQPPRQLHSQTLELPSRQRRTVSAPVVAKSLLSTPTAAALAAAPEPPLQPMQHASPSPSLSTSQPILQTRTSPATSPVIAPVSLSMTTPLASAVAAPVQRYRPPPTLLLPSRLRAAAAAIADAAAASQAAAAASSNLVATTSVAAVPVVAAPAAPTAASPALPSTPTQAASRLPPPPAAVISQPAESLNQNTDSFPLFAARPAAPTSAAAIQSPKVHPLLQQQSQQDQSDLDLDFASPAPSAASRSAQQLPPASMPLHSLSATADTPASSTSLLSMSQPILLSATAPASSLPTQTPSNKELEALFFGLDSDDDDDGENAAAPKEEPQRSASLASTVQSDANAASLVNTIASTAPASLTSSIASRASSSASSTSLAPRSTTSSMDSLSSSLSPKLSPAALGISARAGPVPSVPAVNDGLTPASSAAVILEKLERNLWGTIRSIERSDSMLANLFPTERDREGAEEEEDVSGSESDSSRSSYHDHEEASNSSKRIDRTQPLSETIGDASPVSQLLDMRSPGSLSSTGSSVVARTRPSAATAEFLRKHGTPEQKREQESLDDLDRQMREQEEELRNLQHNYGEILRRQESPNNAQRTHRRPHSGSSSVEVQAALVDEWPALQPVASAVSDRERSDHSVRSSRRSSTQSYTPDVFFASHPNLPPNSPFHHVLNSSGQFSVEDDDPADAAAPGVDDAPHERLDFASNDALVSHPSRAQQPSHHRRMESADVLAEFERTIRVRGLDEDRKSASPASGSPFSRTMPQNAEQSDQWALQSASRRTNSSDLDGFSAPIIMLATRSTDQPIVLYLDKVQPDGTVSPQHCGRGHWLLCSVVRLFSLAIAALLRFLPLLQIMRLCIHQHDNSQQLATLYLRCLSLPTTAEYTAPLSALIQRKISAFVSSVKQERKNMERLIESLRHKLNAAPDDRVAVVRKTKVVTKKKLKRKIKMGEVSLKTAPPVRQRSPSPPPRSFGRHFSLSPPRRPTQLSSSLLVGMSPKSGSMRVGRAPVPLMLPPLMHPLPLPQPIRTSRSRKRSAAAAPAMQARARSASAPRRA